MSNNTTAEDAQDFIKQTAKISVFTPLVYVGILMTAFIFFLLNHRQRRLRELAKIEPLFPENDCANLYATLKSMSTQDDLPALQRPSKAVLKAALLRRAGEVIKRSIKLKEFEQTFEKLYHDGLIGDDIYKQHDIQSKLQELELQDIVHEATELKADWVNTFFPVAQEICFNEAMRRRFYAMEERARELTQQWELDIKEGNETGKQIAAKENSNLPKLENEGTTTSDIDDDESADELSKSPDRTPKKNKKKNKKKAAK